MDGVIPRFGVEFDTSAETPNIDNDGANTLIVAQPGGALLRLISKAKSPFSEDDSTRSGDSKEQLSKIGEIRFGRNQRRVHARSTVFDDDGTGREVLTDRRRRIEFSVSHDVSRCLTIWKTNTEK